MGLRLHLVELEDLSWFPRLLRDLMTDALAAMEASIGVHETIVPTLRDALEKTDSHDVVDLCSGAGGVFPKLRRALGRQGWDVNVTFTDRYPNEKALAAACSREPRSMRYCPEPVDALDVPRQLTGFRTLFTSFHHFRPLEAQAVLSDAYRARAPIAIFEITERSLVAFVRNALTPLACWAVTPRIAPLTCARVLFTYVVPIVPLVLTWDGFVSNLRTYTPDELTRMVSSLRSEDYAWRIGKVKGSFGQVTTYLVGYPTRSRIGNHRNNVHRFQQPTEGDEPHVSL